MSLPPSFSIYKNHLRRKVNERANWWPVFWYGVSFHSWDEYLRKNIPYCLKISSHFRVTGPTDKATSTRGWWKKRTGKFWKKREMIHLEPGWRQNEVDLCCYAWYKMFYFTSKNRPFTANDRSSSVRVSCTEDIILCRMLPCVVASGIIQLQSYCLSSKPTD